MSQTQQRRAYSGATGRVAEVRFKRASEALGLNVTKSTRSEDMNQHVDCLLAVNKEGKRGGVDVKGINLPDSTRCVFKNVRGHHV